MPPPNLRGLNIIQPPTQQNPFLSDQDLLAGPNFPDLTAQLDLWTNLNFQSDEPLPLAAREAHRGKDANYDEKAKRTYSRTTKDAEDETQDNGKVAEVQSHENVVTGSVIPPSTPSNGSTSNLNSNNAYPQPQQPLLNLQGLNTNHALDLNTLLAGFGIDQLQMAAAPPLQQSPSLAQILSLHSAAQTFRAPSQAPSAPPIPPSSSLSITATSTPSAPKRARTSTSSTARATSIVPSAAADSPESLEGDDKQSESPLNAAEDKRRRNTAASARFRLKKKERETALEQKAKELEVRVGELEKECEGLRRENGWLKGLVVGVTGAGAVQQQQQQVAAATGTKRTREEVEASSA